MEFVYKNIKAIRLDKGLTQEDMGTKLNLSQGNYARLEKGTTQLTIERLKQLSDIFEMDIMDVVNYGNTPLTSEDYAELLILYHKQRRKIEQLEADLELSEKEVSDDYKKYSAELGQSKIETKFLKEKVKNLEEQMTQKNKLIDFFINQSNKSKD